MNKFPPSVFTGPWLQVTNAKNVCVVISRWFGGILLGPYRFKHINNCARDLLEECGEIEQRKTK
jgi:putative IMPACT (imprinted ancient) family translation regulator